MKKFWAKCRFSLVLPLASWYHKLIFDVLDSIQSSFSYKFYHDYLSYHHELIFGFLDSVQSSSRVSWGGSESWSEIGPGGICCWEKSTGKRWCYCLIGSIWGVCVCVCRCGYDSWPLPIHDRYHFVISDHWNTGVCLYASERHKLWRNLCLSKSLF